jgi:hypothetical protein
MKEFWDEILAGPRNAAHTGRDREKRTSLQGLAYGAADRIAHRFLVDVVFVSL